MSLRYLPSRPMMIAQLLASGMVPTSAVRGPTLDEIRKTAAYEDGRRSARAHIRTLSPVEAEKVKAAMEKRRRKAEKLANARSMGGIRGTHANQVIFDDLIVSVDPGMQGADQTAQTTWMQTDAGLVLVEG